MLVGDNPASRAYVRSKDKMCRDLGLHSVKLELPADTTQAELLARVEELNRDPAIHGILVQSPPPKQIDEAAIVRALDPAKDVDGFHPVNVAKLALGDETGFVPVHAARLSAFADRKRSRNFRRARCRSRPQHDRRKTAGASSHAKRRGGDATVTVVHSRSQRLAEITRSADILIAAIGQPEFVRAEHVRDGAVVIDVGINRVDDATTERGYRLVGDVAFDEVSQKSFRDHASPGRSGPDDDRDADGEHGQGLRRQVFAVKSVCQRTRTFARVRHESKQRRLESRRFQERRGNSRR